MDDISWTPLSSKAEYARGQGAGVAQVACAKRQPDSLPAQAHRMACGAQPVPLTEQAI